MVWFEIIQVAFVAGVLGPVTLVPQDSTGVNHRPVVVHVVDVWCDEVDPLNSTDVDAVKLWRCVVLEVRPVWNKLTLELGGRPVGFVCRLKVLNKHPACPVALKDEENLGHALEIL